MINVLVFATFCVASLSIIAWLFILLHPAKPWDFQPFTDASKQFVRGGKSSSPTLVKGLARFPFVSPKLPDTPREPSK